MNSILALQQVPTYTLEQVLPPLLGILVVIGGAAALGFQQIVKGYFAFVDETKKQNAELRAELTKQEARSDSAERDKRLLQARVDQLEAQQAETDRRAKEEAASREQQIAALQRKNEVSESLNRELKDRITQLEALHRESERKATADRTSKDAKIDELTAQVRTLTESRERERLEHEERQRTSKIALDEAIAERDQFRDRVEELVTSLERERHRVDDLTTRLDKLAKGDSDEQLHPIVDADPGTASQS